jgi:hypothetical protein
MTTNEESSPPALPTSQTGGDASPFSWKTLFDAIEDGACVQSIESRIVYANGAFADIAYLMVVRDITETVANNRSFIE